MMRQMRENTKWIMLATAVAFVGLMVFQWGMDITGRSGLTQGEIGSVNGDGVPWEAYNFSYQRIFDQYQGAQADPITSQQVSEIEDAAWDDVVSQILVQQELRRRGIQITDEEIRSAARFSPPPEFRTNPAFMTEGLFDIQKYQQFITAPTVDPGLLLQLEAYYRDIIPRGKLLRQVSSDVYLTDAALWDAFRDQNELVEVRYIPLNPGQRIADSLVSVSAGEVNRYYQEHREEFSIPAQAQVRVVVIDKTPIAGDSLEAGAIAAAVRQELLDGTDWDEVLSRPSVDAGSGELGWFTRERMVEPFSDAAFSASVGRLTEPVQTSFGFHVIDVQEKTADSIRARHILIPYVRTEESELELLTLADSLEELGENQTLADAAAGLDLEVANATLSVEFAFIPGAGRASEGADWAFEEGVPGDVSPVFETAQAFYMMELTEVSPEGFISVEDARASIEQALSFEKKMAIAVAEAEEVLTELRGGGAFANVAADRGLEIRAPEAFTRGDFVPGMGRMNAAIGASFGMNENDVSDVIQANSNVFLIQQIGFTPADSAVFETERATQRESLIETLQQARLQQWLQGLRDGARIVDKRDEVLNQDPATEAQQRRQIF